MSESTLSRREFLKRGAVVGGAAVWMTPVVQTVGMSSAFAQATSPGDCAYIFAVKIELNRVDGVFDWVCDVVSGSDQGNCLGETYPDACDSGKVVSVVPVESGGEFVGVVITLQPDCQVQDGAIKAGDGDGGCYLDDDDDSVLTGEGTNVATFTLPGTATNEISHVELVFCCDTP